MKRSLTRRQFVAGTAAAAVASGAILPAAARAAEPAAKPPDTSKILNYNPDMEYRRCGKTGLMVSAIALGGHWKRVVKIIGGSEPRGWMSTDIAREAFQKNRADVMSRCIEKGINYVDACCGEEILAYSRALKGRRDKMYFGFSWHVRESRFPEWRSAKKLQEGLDLGLKEAGLDHCDLWRISLLVDSGKHTKGEIEEAVAALDWAKKSGRARFVGVSSHDRANLKHLVETYPKQMEVILTPYTAKTRVVTDEAGLWAAIKKHDVGWLGIKPFASNSVFKGDGSPDSPHVEQDNKTARLCIRCILANPAITAPMPGLISVQQVDNVCAALKEPRDLDAQERSHLDRAMTRAWASLPSEYAWLKEWETV